MYRDVCLCMCREDGIMLYLIPLKQGFSLTLELDWDPASPGNLPDSNLHRIGITGMNGHPWLFTWVLGI